jgi:hypothetical protein
MTFPGEVVALATDDNHLGNYFLPDRVDADDDFDNDIFSPIDVKSIHRAPPTGTITAWAILTLPDSTTRNLMTTLQRPNLDRVI